jgi:hypothetical protein
MANQLSQMAAASIRGSSPVCRNANCRQFNCSDPQSISNVEKWEANHPPPAVPQTNEWHPEELGAQQVQAGEEFEQDMDEVSFKASD